MDDAPDEPGLAGSTIDPHGDGRVHRLGYRAWWGLPALPKLNTSNPAVREYLFGVAEHWLRFGIDGWRLDVPTEIRDEAFWQEFRRRCRAVNPDAYIVGEIWHEAPEWLAGDRFDAVMNYPLAEAILGYAAQGHLNEPVVRAHHEYGHTVHRRDGAAFGAELERLMAVYDRAVTDVQLNLLGSPRQPALPDDGVAATGTRTTSPCCSRRRCPGAPCTYYGDEVGLEGGNDPDCRGAFPWDEDRWDPRRRSRGPGTPTARGSALPALRRGGVPRGRRDRRTRSRSSAAPARPTTPGGPRRGERRRVGGATCRRSRRRWPARRSSMRRCRGRRGLAPVTVRGGRPGHRPGRGAHRPDPAPGLARPLAGPAHPRRRPSFDPDGARRARPAYARTTVADLPFQLAEPLAQRLRAAVDVEGKIVRALDALGPLAGRRVAFFDLPPGRLRDELGAAGIEGRGSRR